MADWTLGLVSVTLLRCPAFRQKEDDMYSLKPEHLADEQRKILRPVALAYRRVMRAPAEAAVTRAEISRRDQKRQNEALAAATAGYRRVGSRQPARIIG